MRYRAACLRCARGSTEGRAVLKGQRCPGRALSCLVPQICAESKVRRTLRKSEVKGQSRRHKAGRGEWLSSAQPADSQHPKIALPSH